MNPTGIPPITCAPWCKDNDGHPSAVSRGDQNCWGPDHPVHLSIEEVHATGVGNPGDEDFRWEIDTPHLTPCAYRGFNQHPLVYLHIWMPNYHRDGLDTSVHLTADEARQLAATLITVAETIGGAR